MYVDKPLTGVAAVQTLSRLNRIHPLKSQDDVRVLDFVNSADDDPGRRSSPGSRPRSREPADPNLLYAKQREVMAYALLGVPGDGGVHPGAGGGRTRPDAGRCRAGSARAAAWLPPARHRPVPALDTDDEREGFRKALQDYTRAYASSRRSSTGAIRTWNGSTSTGGCC